MTRKLVAGLFTSVDGVVSAPHEFQLDSFDDGVGAAMNRMIGSVDDVVMGRITYQEWAPYWPTATDEFGDFINPVAKHVASTTLGDDDLTWNNSHLLQGNLEDAVRELKAGEGRDISVCGSISVVRQLVEAGLMDELTLIVHPVVAGKGVRLFDQSPLTRLTLLGVEHTEKGNLIATYGPRA